MVEEKKQMAMENYKYDVGRKVYITLRRDGEFDFLARTVRSKKLNSIGQRVYSFEEGSFTFLLEAWVFSSLEEARIKIEQVRGA